jgi:hypothetical protein
MATPLYRHRGRCSCACGLLADYPWTGLTQSTVGEASTCCVARLQVVSGTVRAGSNLAGAPCKRCPKTPTRSGWAYPEDAG